MAKPTWVTINPSSGFGNATLVFTATKHTGRIERSGVVNIANTTGDAMTANINIMQSGAALNLVPIHDPAVVINVPASGQTVTLSGSSNVGTIKVTPDVSNAFNKATLKLTIDGTVVQPTADYQNGKSFVLSAGQGSTIAYNWILEFVIPPRTVAGSTTFALDFDTESEGVNLSFNFEVAGAANFLNVSTNNLSFASASESKNVELTSNDNWVAT